MPLTHIPEEKEKEKGNNLNINDKENSKVNVLQINPSNILGPKSISSNISSNNLVLNKNGNNSKIMLKKDQIYVLDVLSKQKNELRKLMLKNSNINRRWKC